MAHNRIKNVAIVGATGHCGQYMTQAILDAGKHTLTALTRAESEAQIPSGVIRKVIDYNKAETITEALRGQDALIITLPGLVPFETEVALMKGANEAGVRWILNDWGVDSVNEKLVEDVSAFEKKVNVRKVFQELDDCNYISLSTGFWYEWSLSSAMAFGIDLLNHSATLFDEGETRITVSTWPQVGRAVAGILSLPINAEGSGSCLEDLKNKVLYLRSFTVNQQEMLESACRVTGTKREDWKITREPSSKRYEESKRQMQEGNFEGFVKMMYTRVFYPDGCGNVDHKGTVNKLLALPEEDLDAATMAALERAKAQA
ncbi:hypothetical protein N7539_002150 [Penicillium diatomitis]|uniref:NmrA-like domain-containing protein n=1 Tax=Penicillium diatomitis TaxID=2819901 RepID=A0A9X0C0W7_9EURO|nr:uncharacterized protein N7539_002150 [Penicillium diatomitis]KAJ5493404.1 hypothetical protein N7539_002150 [Penicillium diatomitis]